MTNLQMPIFRQKRTVNAGSKKKGPRHAYMFAGPSGVGKTFIAETIADTLGIPYKRFDMSAYSHRSNAQDLVGHNTAWNNANPGVLNRTLSTKILDAYYCLTK